MLRYLLHWGKFIFLATALTISACGPDSNTSPASSVREREADPVEIRGGTYRIPLEIKPITIDPAHIEDRFGLHVAYQVFEGLLRYGPYLSIAPAVAESWQVEDQGKTIRFFLRKDVYFHHGRRVTSKDVIFSLERIIKIKPPPLILPHLLKIKGSQDFLENKSQHVRGLIRIDDFQLEMNLSEPYAPLLTALAMYQAAVVPEEVVRQKGDKFGRSPVGCGAFVFEAWQSDDTIRLIRFPEYHGGPAFLDTIEFQVYPGAQRDRVLADFQSGKLHEMSVYGAVRQKLSKTENFRWVHRPSLSLLFYGINTSHPQLKDPRLRRALSIAIDRANLVESVYKSQFEPAYNVLPPGMPGYNREDKVIEEDFAAAKKIVQKLQLPQSGGKPVIEIVSASQSAFAKAELGLIEERWEPLGIETRIKYITDWSEFEAYLESGSMQLYRYAWTADMPDPDNFMNPLFGSDSPVNYTRFNQPDIDLQLKQAAGMVDPVQRAQKYQQIEKQVMQACPIIPLFYLSIDRVYQPDVKGMNVSALGAQAVRLHRVWLSSSER